MTTAAPIALSLLEGQDATGNQVYIQLLHCALIGLALGGAASGALAEELVVAVASNFVAPLQEIVPAFEKATGNQVRLVPGSTGKLYAQITNGAPYDVLVAADQGAPKRLAAEGYAIADSQFTYAVGKLTLWSPTAGYVDDRGQVLKKGGFRHLSVANPELAPYGAAAVTAMKALGIYEALKPKIVQGENISQTHQFVATGAAELGFVALSQVLKAGKVAGSVWMVPVELYPPLRQDAILLARGRVNSAAGAFLAYLTSDAARAVIASYGYDPGSPRGRRAP
jgi:molybdate transport system substrate-binding protein